jgi:exonuclease VII large subunit
MIGSRASKRQRGDLSPNAQTSARCSIAVSRGCIRAYGSEGRVLSSIHGRIAARARAIVAERERRVRGLVAALDAMSPLKVLARGYAIATTEEGRAIRDTSDVKVGDTVSLRVAHGNIATRVTKLDREA